MKLKCCKVGRRNMFSAHSALLTQLPFSLSSSLQRMTSEELSTWFSKEDGSLPAKSLVKKTTVFSFDLQDEPVLLFPEGQGNFHIFPPNLYNFCNVEMCIIGN